MSAPRYNAYRSSGSTWLPDVPTHWEIRTLRSLGKLLKGGGGSKEDASEDGVPCVRYGDIYMTHHHHILQARTRIPFELSKHYTPVRFGDVLFAASGEKMEEIGKSAANLIREDAFCGGDLIILRPTQPVHPEFLGYVTDCYSAAAQKASMGRGTTIKHIYPDELRHLLLPIPPIDEQRAIAAFLDRETGKMAALIAEQERLIELLQEKRQAVVTDGVTKGLKPGVPMRDSGVEWIGAVPRNWEVGSAGRYVTVVSGFAFPSSEFTHTDLDTRLLRGVNVGVRSLK